MLCSHRTKYFHTARDRMVWITKKLPPLATKLSVFITLVSFVSGQPIKRTVQLYRLWLLYYCRSGVFFLWVYLIDRAGDKMEGVCIDVKVTSSSGPSCCYGNENWAAALEWGQWWLGKGEKGRKEVCICLFAYTRAAVYPSQAKVVVGEGRKRWRKKEESFCVYVKPGKSPFV